MKISNFTAREILDCHGLPTIECTITLDHAYSVSASVPNGISCGTDEAHVLVDGGKRYHGLGVQKAVSLLNNQIKKMLLSKEPDIKIIDTMLLDYDGTTQKTTLGANSMLCVSIAICRAQAVALGCKPYQLIHSMLPRTNKKKSLQLCFNVINGGMHVPGSMDIQEIMLVTPPLSFVDQIEIGLAFLSRLKEIISQRGIFFAQGIEGGIGTAIQNENALEIVHELAIQFSTEIKNPLSIALDMAASHLYNTESQTYFFDKKTMSSQELFAWYTQLLERYPLCFIEDPFDSHDTALWQKLQSTISQNCFIAGDDLYVTDAEKIKDPTLSLCAQGVIIKPNQRGTISETIQAVQAAYSSQKAVIASHRSRETCDSFLADLAIGIDASYLKAGCLGSERMAKYNRLTNLFV